MDKVRQKMTEKSFLLLFLLIVVVSIVRPFFIPQDILFTYYGIGSGVVTGVIYLYLANTPSHNWHPYLFALVSLCLLLPLIVISGGINSHFVPLLPLMPVLFCIIASRRAAQLFTAMLLVYIALLYVFADLLPAADSISASDAANDMRALWLFLSCLLGIVFGSEFDKMSRALGTKLLESNSNDELTGVSSRISVLDDLENRIELSTGNQEWMSVFIVDIDEFKRLNDAYGRQTGDVCLQQVARLIQLSVRGKGDLVGRFGGEEFLIVLEGVDQSAAHRIAEKIRTLVEELEIISEGERVKISATIGYCSLPFDQIHSSEQLLQAADSALVAGKAAGKNQVVGADQAMVTGSIVVNH